MTDDRSSASRHENAARLYAFESHQSSQQQADFGELLEKAKRGDTEACDALWRQCEKFLLAIAHRDLAASALQKFGASDVVQQSMLIAHRKLPEFQGTSKTGFFAWIKQIAVFECRQTSGKYCNTAKRAVSREVSTTGTSSSQIGSDRVSDPHLTPSTQAVNDEQADLVRRAMLHLKPLHRQVIQFRNWEDCSFEEIGRRIGRGSDAARKLWARAVSKLEFELKQLNAI